MRRLLLALIVLLAVPTAARADTVVSLGDSAISGEAGRWAGNTNQSSSKTDALGPTAYFDNANGTGEAIPGCHRSKSAEVHIGGGVTSVNLACSGARTYSRVSDSNFKPGIDFYNSGGNKGQALALQELAGRDKGIKAVVVLIGANNYGFADIVQTCVTDWLTSPSWWKNYCQDDSNITAMFTQSNINTITTQVRGAFQNVRNAMLAGGYADGTYKILAQTYSAPIPKSAGFRYGETGFTRQTVGGCGVWNKDANWARDTVVTTLNNTVRNAVAGMANVQVLNMDEALAGRKLCENTVGLLEERGISTWRSAGAVDNSEWVQQIRTLTTLFPPYQLQEDAHPNYWGQLALRNCFRQAYNGGAVRGGTCSRGTGLNGNGEPNMTLG
ncbi:hypothetical protein [Solirubrobacter soli]|uniref:hypothetical protein n=1 Tax=Solirubrobacter soli TaxID=363832 RepID=UPI00041606F0|nr:hypothetical protein [Solirubrobacter soli]